MKTLKITLAFLLTFSVSAIAHDGKHQENAMFKGTDTSAAKVVLAFHQALETGNKELARELLADDVTIYEGGGVERSADEYAQHHMLSDMEYLAAVKNKTIEHQVEVLGNAAISMSRRHTSGSYKGNKHDYESMETIVLGKQNDEWKIKHIHWSR